MLTLATLQIAVGIVWLGIFLFLCFGYDAIGRYKDRKQAKERE